MLKIIRFWKAIAVFLIVIVFIVFVLSRGHVYSAGEISYGITFSEKQARDLGLDWKKAYLDILDGLGVKKLRLSAYWNEVEANQGVYNWNDLDWMLEEAGNRDIEVILAVGSRLPRWPECHFPTWVNDLDDQAKQESLLAYIKKTIERYQDRKAIIAWQVENEPFLPNFGECPKLDSSLLDQEISLVKSMDKRPVVVTDSGELSLWYPAAHRADIFGTTMYRDTYSEVLERYVHYPIQPGFFRMKKNLVSLFARPEKWMVIELQAEPWAPVPFQEVSEEERSKTMDAGKFNKMIEFAQMTGFKEFYLWGAEWWYWEKTVNHDSTMWDEAGALFMK